MNTNTFVMGLFAGFVVGILIIFLVLGNLM